MHRLVILLTITLGLMACTISSLNTKLTSTKAVPQSDGGIGGTGITCSTSESATINLEGAGIVCLSNTGGIGGTGLTDWSGGIGGTGVFGTITGFGSLIINGLHIAFEPDQSVESMSGGITGQDLHIGQVVAIQANNVGSGLVAQRIILQTALVGQVEAIDRDQSEMVIAGERIVILPNVSNIGFSLEQVEIGDTLAISGTRTSEKLYASYATRALENSLIKGQAAMASGVITKINNTQFTLDNSLIINLSADVADEWTIGDFVTVELDITSPQLKNKNKVQKPSKLVKKWYADQFGGQLQRLSNEHITAGTEAVDSKKAEKINRNVQFFSRDSANKMRLKGSLQTEAEVWQRPSVKELKPKTKPGKLDANLKAVKKAGSKNTKKESNSISGKSGSKNNSGKGSSEKSKKKK